MKHIFESSLQVLLESGFMWLPHLLSFVALRPQLLRPPSSQRLDMLVVMLTRPAVDQLFIRNCWYPLLGINCGWKIPWQMEVFSWEHHCINGYKWWIFGSIPHCTYCTCIIPRNRFEILSDLPFLWDGVLLLALPWIIVVILTDYLPMFQTLKRSWYDLLDGVSSQTPINHHQPTTTEIHQIVFPFRNHY